MILKVPPSLDDSIKKSVYFKSGVKPKKTSYLDKYTTFQPNYKFSSLQRAITTYPISFS